MSNSPRLWGVFDPVSETYPDAVSAIQSYWDAGYLLLVAGGHRIVFWVHYVDSPDGEVTPVRGEAWVDKDGQFFWEEFPKKGETSPLVKSSTPSALSECWMWNNQQLGSPWQGPEPTRELAIGAAILSFSGLSDAEVTFFVRPLRGATKAVRAHIMFYDGAPIDWTFNDE